MRPHQPLLTFLLRTVDMTIIVGGLYASTFAYGNAWTSDYLALGLVSLSLFYWIARQRGLYDSWRLEEISAELRQVFSTWGTVALYLLAIAFVTKMSSDFSRISVTTWFIATPLLLVSARIFGRSLLKHARSKGYNTRECAIVGADHLAQRLARKIQHAPWMGLNIHGFYDNLLERHHVPDQNLGLSVQGTLDQLVKEAKAGRFDIIYLAMPMKAVKLMQELVLELADSSAQVEFVPDVFTFNMLNSRVKDVGGLPTISVYDTPMDGLGALAKRLEDIALASLILIMIAAPMLLIAAAVKFTSAGPVIFKQRRYGLNGDPIYVWKFRSMTTSDNGDVIKQASRDDERVTSVGRFLRRTSLDELPQFFNVLQGSMSIVGPRPHAVAHNEEYRQEISGYMQRHLVKPGITGWAQINGLRGETDTLEKMAKRIDHDMYYIRNWSLGMDLRIIFLTIFKGFVDKNAY